MSDATEKTTRLILSSARGWKPWPFVWYNKGEG